MVGLGERILTPPGQKNQEISKEPVSGLHSTVQIFNKKLKGVGGNGRILGKKYKRIRKSATF